MNKSPGNGKTEKVVLRGSVNRGSERALKGHFYALTAVRHIYTQAPTKKLPAMWQPPSRMV